MHLFHSRSDRRGFVASLAFGAAFFTVPGLFAEELTRTPDQTKGPFYPDRLPLDTDNDLLIVNDKITPAVGEVSHVAGRILDAKGNPVRNALVEIWQCDSNGAYLHSKSANRKKYDTNFQGFGRFLTGSKGEYYFRTIKPVPYPGRTPHIHFLVKQGRKELLATQMYIKGHPMNARDGILNDVEGKARDALLAEFVPIKGAKVKAYTVNWDVVLGVTPAE
jgi:protocatechuate 3,4-dioxygenase beta subunit